MPAMAGFRCPILLCRVGSLIKNKIEIGRITKCATHSLDGPDLVIDPFPVGGINQIEEPSCQTG